MSFSGNQTQASSGNVFAELTRPDVKAHMHKSQIAAELYRLTRARTLLLRW
jgi:hypothetical protein